jgi:hypothetical protein
VMCVYVWVCDVCLWCMCVYAIVRVCVYMGVWFLCVGVCVSFVVFVLCVCVCVCARARIYTHRTQNNVSPLGNAAL